MKTFLFQINVTRDCNIRCSHCYISSDKKASSKTMPAEQLIEIATKIRDFLIHDHNTKRQYGFADIHVIGGEPTMLGLDFYKETLPAIKNILEQAPQTVKLSIVSNLIDKDSIEIARLFGEVSTSYEVETRFPKRKLEERWESAVKELASDPEVNLSVTGSITKQAINYGAGNLMEYFNSLGLEQAHMGFFIPSGDGLVNQLLVFPAFHETSEFLIELTNWYVGRRDNQPSLAINPVESLISSIYYNEPADDIVCPIIPGSLDFDWDGNTVTCIEKAGELGVDWIGNVFRQDIIDILESEDYIKERLVAASPKRICRDCEEYAVCQSACTVLHQHWDGAGECPGFKKWIKHVRELVEKGVEPKFKRADDAA